jgi:hypothetical protein
MRVPEAIANSCLDAIVGQLDGGNLEIFDGSAPAAVDGELELQTLLVRLPLAAPAFFPATNFRVISRPIGPALVAATGIASWARLVSQTGENIADLSVGRTVDGADLRFDHLEFVVGTVVDISSLVMIFPMGPD